VGNIIDLQVSVGNTGPGSIGVNKVRAQISIPIAIATALPNAQQSGLPAGWIILTNTGAGITICNGTDIIPAGEQRQLFIKIQGTAVGGPSTINGSLSFGPGTGVCTGPGSLPGDNTADNTSTTSITVLAVSACGITATASAGTIACNGGNTTLTALPTGAAGPTECSLDGINFQPGNTFTVGAGTYTITVREIGRPSCSVTIAPVTITEPLAVPTPLLNTITQPTCSTTGSVELTGLPSGSWTVTTDPGGIVTTGTGTSTIITGLTGGTYTFMVTNSAGCTSPVSAEAAINAVTVPNAPVVSIVQPTCAVASGTVIVTSTTTGLTFSLDGNTYAIYPAGGYTIPTGTHTLNSKNADGCSSPVINLVIDVQPPTPAVLTIDNITQPTCVVSTGSVNLSGLPSGNWTINPGNIAGNTAATTISDLSPGTYNFTVTNDAGCTSVATSNVIISIVPGTPAAPVITVVQPTCSLATGTITITSTTAALTFSLDGNPYATYPAGGYIVSAGPHTIAAQNSSNCISPLTNIIVNAQPATPPAPTVSIVQPTCNVPTGNITVTSATTGLTFSLDGNTYTIYPAGGYDLLSGTHTLISQNSDGCISAVTDFTVNVQPSSPTGSAVGGTISCNSGSTSLTITASGGTPPYEYSLDNNNFQPGNSFIVVAGTYTVTIRDANLCLGTIPNVIIAEPAAIVATASTDIAQLCSSLATIKVNASGGSGLLSYSLNGGAFQAANTFTVDASGSPYQVTVKDANNCSATSNQVVVTLPATLTAVVGAPRITHCGGTTEVTVSGQGGVPPYSGTGTFTKGPGNWSFSVTDSRGCVATAEINIEAPGCLYLNVYPNPTKNAIYINHSIAGSGATMQIFSITGAKVMQKNIPENSFFTTMDVSKLSSATYIIVYVNDGERKQVKFEKVSSK